MSHNPPVRRYRVVLRPKVRSQRLRQAAATLAVGLLGALAAATARHVPVFFPSWRGLEERLLPPVAAVELLGAPESLKASVLEYLASPEARAYSADEKARGLLSRFGVLSSVRIRRDWLRSGLRVELRTHSALGRAEASGRPAGYLSEAGTLFSAPEGLYAGAGPLPALEVSGAGPADLKALAEYLAEMGGGQALPSRLERMRFLSPSEGWEARLQDGTTVLWGSLDWTAEKAERLRAVLSDARSRLGGRLSADMRYFEDGKILLKPVGAASGAKHG